MQVNDPRLIPDTDLPLIVFADQTDGLMAFLIKWRTKGEYNHVMIMHKPWYVASQGNTYTEFPISRYMLHGGRLKFFRLVLLTSAAKIALINNIQDELKKSWWQRSYDYLGLLGQAIGLKWLNMPGLHYCSEDVVYHLKEISEYLLTAQQKIINEIPNHGSPQELHDYFQRNPTVFSEYGKWEADDGVIA